MSAQLDRVQGNFYSFEFFIEAKINGAVRLGSPKICTWNSAIGEMRWGAAIEWSWPDPTKLRVPWVDGARNSLAKRKVRRPQDVLGAEGTIGDQQFQFESILDCGKNVIVYALYCGKKNFRLAYGFDRSDIEPEGPTQDTWLNQLRRIMRNWT